MELRAATLDLVSDVDVSIVLIPVVCLIDLNGTVHICGRNHLGSSCSDGLGSSHGSGSSRLHSGI